MFVILSSMFFVFSFFFEWCESLGQGSHRSGKIFEDFFQSGKSGKNRGFSAKLRKKNLKSGNFFSKPFQPFKPFNLRKKKFLSGEVLLLGSVSVINTTPMVSGGHI